MASGVFNKGKNANNYDFANDTIKFLLVGTSYTFNPDSDFVTDISSDELSGTGYSRQTLSGKTTTEDDTADEVKHDADDITYSGADFGEVQGGIAYKEVTDDTDSILLAYCELGSSVTTNGGDFTFQFGSDGVFKAT